MTGSRPMAPRVRIIGDVHGKDEYQVPTLVSGDGTRPSNPTEWQNDFSEEALSRNGYNLRNYLTLVAYAEVIEKVSGR